MSRKPKQGLEAYADKQAQARFAENQDISRRNRTLQVALAETRQDLEAAQGRLAQYEHPSVVKLEKALASRKSITLKEVATLFGISSHEANGLLREMAERGYNVRDGVLSKQAGGRSVPVEHFYGPEVRFGVVSDTHLGNHHALEDQLHEAYEVFRREGITTVYSPGNLVDGEKTYRGQEYEITVMGVENVVQYVARMWPRVPGITTYHVASSTCHEGYYLKSAGVLLGKLIEIERPDMKYLGLDEADIVLQDTEARPTLRIVHPGGGTSYADSYRPQKIVESYSGSEKPTILVIGHYHKTGYYDIRDVAVLQAGCLERQTPFMRKLSLRAALGFWTVEAHFTADGSLRRFRPEFWKYYIGQGGKILRTWNAA